MKDLKVRTKMLIGFSIVAILALIVGIVGIFGLNSMNGTYTEAIDLHAKPLEDAGSALADLHSMRAELRGAMLFSGNLEKVQAQEDLLLELQKDFEAHAEIFGASIIKEDARALLDEALTVYRDSFLPAANQILQDARQGAEIADLTAYMSSTVKPAVDKVAANLEQCMTIKGQNLEEASLSADTLATRMLVLLIGISVVAVIASVLLGLYISGLISNPLSVLTAFMKKAGATGDIFLRPDDIEIIEKYGGIKDETGQCIGATAKFIVHITNVAKALESISGGDLTINVEALSDADTMGVSLNSMLSNLNMMFGEIRVATAQVSTGSDQIAQGSQALAQGSTEQAATVQELSAAITEIAQRTTENTEMAEQSSELANTIMQDAKNGSGKMDEMIAAVNEINQASQDINQVIKVIDNIAFQTNILALNAAVEAARAGQHGKGFAVVADEVRSLAAKSSEAAKNTSVLIANSMEKAALGSQIADETAASFTKIVSGINKSTEIAVEIARSSEVQTAGIKQINDGIEQVVQVVQQNSATAEQSAAASQELNSQASILDELIARFKVNNTEAANITSFPAAAREKPQSGKPEVSSFALYKNPEKY